MVGGKSADGERRHELLRAFRHHRTHGGPALAQAPDQVEALIGRDAARNDKQDAFAAENHGLLPVALLTAVDPKPLADNMQSPLTPKLCARPA